MPNTPLLEALGQRTLICDGAMGTQLIAAGMLPGACSEKWNTEKPEKIKAVHRAYLEAGCHFLTTNTFGGNSFVLAKHGLADQVQILNSQAARIAREVAGDAAWILGDIGPCGEFLEPLGVVTCDEAKASFIQQAKALHEGGADAILVETMTDPQELTLAIAAAKSVANCPVIATYAFDLGQPGSFHTMMGLTVEQAMRSAIDAGADVVGANCGTGLTLENYLQLSEQLLGAAGQTPVILQPNAGAPTLEDAKEVYPAHPQEMAHLASELQRAGIGIIGGCCGTTPDHLRAMAEAIA